MNILSLNQKIKDNSIYYDWIPFANSKSNLNLLIHKISECINQRSMHSFENDLRNKSIIRLGLITVIPSISLIASLILGTPITGLASVGLCHLVVAVYDLASRYFYSEKYYLEKIENAARFFLKAPPELRTDLEFILKVIDKNEQVIKCLPAEFFDFTFLNILTKRKKKIDLTQIDMDSRIRQQGVDKYFSYDSLKQEDLPKNLPLITGAIPDQNIEKTLPVEIIKKEILKWLSIASITKLSMTNRAFKLTIQPLLNTKINAFFKCEVQQILKGMHICLYASDQPNVYPILIGNYITQVKSGLIDINSYQSPNEHLFSVKPLQMLINSDFDTPIPQNASPLFENLCRVESIKYKILFAFDNESLKQYVFGHAYAQNINANDPFSLAHHAINRTTWVV